MSSKRLPPVIIVGSGAVGTALALALHKHRYPVLTVVSKSGRSARRLGRRIHSSYGRLRSLALPKSGGIIFLAVPDDEIRSAANLLSQQQIDFSRSIVFHCSGALVSDELAELKKKGASVGSFHPLQTFVRRSSSSDNLRGIWIGIEGDRAAIARGEHIAKDIGAHSLVLSRKQKVLYHIAAVFSSNYLVTLLSVVEELGTRIRLPQRKVVTIFKPLILESISNVNRLTAAGSLTGPIARGDLRTVRKHRAELNKRGLGRISLLYDALAKATVHLASKRRP